MIDNSEIQDENKTVTASENEVKIKKKSGIIGDVLKLVFGTGSGQVISAISYLFLSRLYEPNSIGLFGIYISISGILTVISCLRYELSINLPSSDKDGANQLAISFMFSVLLSFLLIPTIWLTGNFISGFFNSPELVPYLWFLPINMLLGGVSLTLNYWNARTLKFGRLSLQIITNMMVTACAQISLGFRPNAGAGELIIGSLLGTIAGVGLLAIKVWKDDHQLFVSSIRWHTMIEGIKRYKKFPIFNVWSSFLNNLSWQLPTFMLTHFFSPTISGYYTIGNRVLRVPMSLIGGAISQAQYPRLARAREDGSLSKIIESTMNRLISYSLFPMLVLSLIGSELFIILFGPKWAEAGIYTQILSIWTIFWFISSPLSNIFSILEEQEKALRINIFIFITRLISLWVGGIVGIPRVSIMLFAFTGVFVYGYMSFIILKLANVSVKNILRTQWKYFRLFIPVGLTLGCMIFFSVKGWIQLIFAGLSLLVYFYFIIKDDEIISGIIKKKIHNFTAKKTG